MLDEEIRRTFGDDEWVHTRGAVIQRVFAHDIYHCAEAGALLVEGEIVGTWRRANEKVDVEPWRRLSRAQRDAVVEEAESLPLPGAAGRIVVRWQT